MIKETGGAAFPNYRSDANANWGMTLRDYFAAKALPESMRYGIANDWSSNDVADYAFQVADAMLVWREA